MEEEKKRKTPIDLDWEKLLPSRDEEPPPVLVVTTSGREPSAMSGEQFQQSWMEEELSRMGDKELNDSIFRHRRNVETLGPKLPDKGEKLKATLKCLEDERERRESRRMEEDDDGCEKPMQSNNPSFISASDGFRQEAPSSLLPSQSAFASCFCRKLEENQTDCRTVNAFENELSTLNRCDRRKTRSNGQFSPRGRRKSALSSRQPHFQRPCSLSVDVDKHILPNVDQKGMKSALSSRKSPFQCPSSLSVDVDKHILSNGDPKGEHSSTCSSRHFEENLCISVSKKRNTSRVLPSNDLRRRNGRTFVLVDEEEPQLIDTTEQANKVDKCLKETKIYYPSRDDPESVEICYSDMECLAPEGYLSSTIMNFYIRYLQQPTSPTNRAQCDYHFFNTYFYKKLKEAVLNKRSGKETSFVKFRRWWKGVNIFQKAYIFLPIHDVLHWSLVIICIPDKEDESGPIILHLDSLGLHYSKPIFDNIRSGFLREEWNYLNQGEAPPDLPIAERIWKNLPRRIIEEPIAVPQQRNEYDCGLFVLFFMERFIEEAPERLKKKDLAMFGKQWFKPEQASGLRRKIRKLLMEEFYNSSKDKCALDPKPLSSVGASEKNEHE
uniref:Putative ubiquitin-like-specific protease 1D isoform X2 n=1 Tax=Davidia involucrata TaxID=16924 RepID=A0A5B6ZMV5_DAVIN